jgi:hypothetical protein
MSNLGRMSENTNKKSYNIIFNSQNKISSGASLSNCTFGMDWSVIPEDQYKVHFTFVTKIMNLSSTDIGCININLGSSTVFQASNKVSAVPINFLGISKPYLISTTSYLLSEDNTNPPIYIHSRPSENFVNIVINGSDNTTLFTPTTGSMVDWILHLRLVPIGFSE